MKASLAALLFCCSLVAAAQPVRCVDAQGKIVYRDAIPGQDQRCRPVRGEASVVSPQDGGRAAAKASRRFEERRAAEASAAANAERRVEAAEQRLAAAQKALAEQEAVRTGDERNYARVLERLEPYRKEVEAAHKELEAARRSR